MRFLTTSIVIAAAFISVHHDVQAEIDCKEMEDIGGIIMEGRQAGFPISRMYDISDGNIIMDILVEAAFEKSRWHTKSSQQRAIEDFKEFSYKLCRNIKKEE